MPFTASALPTVPPSKNFCAGKPLSEGERPHPAGARLRSAKLSLRGGPRGRGGGERLRIRLPCSERCCLCSARRLAEALAAALSKMSKKGRRKRFTKSFFRAILNITYGIFVNAKKRNSTPWRGLQRAAGRCEAVDAHGRTRRRAACPKGEPSRSRTGARRYKGGICAAKASILSSARKACAKKSGTAKPVFVSLEMKAGLFFSKKRGESRI